MYYQTVARLIQAQLYANIRRSSRVAKPQLNHAVGSIHRSQTTLPLSDRSGSVTPKSLHSEIDGSESDTDDFGQEKNEEFDENRRYPARRHRQPLKRLTL